MNVWTWRSGWDPLNELQRQVDRLFDFTLATSRQLWQTWRQFPAINLYETANEFILIAPLPGMQPEDLEITTAGNTLTLKGERKRPASAVNEHYRREERWLGKWSRTIAVPEKADLEQVNATLENGLLILHLPKAPESQPRQVPVKVKQPASQAGKVGDHEN
jgi:HSP20 family protein